MMVEFSLFYLMHLKLKLVKYSWIENSGSGKLTNLFIPIFSIRKVFFLSILVLSYISPTTLKSQEKANKNVLILYSFSQSYPAMVEWDRGLRSEFNNQKDFNITIITEYLDLSRFSETDYFEKVINLFHYKYQYLQPDLVIAVFDPAYAFVLKHGREIFPEVPFIFGGIEKTRSEINALDDKMMCIFQGTAVAQETLNIALIQNPRTTDILVISGDGFTERIWLNGARNILDQFAKRVNINYLIGNSLTEIKEEVQNLPETTIILYFPFLEDKEKNKYVATEVLDQIARVSSVPIYSFWEIFVGHGSVGGYLRDLPLQAKTAAKSALFILNDPDIDNFSSFEITDHQYIFDDRQLKHWSIAESSLPAGSEIRFQEYSFWEKYFYRIILFLALFFLQSFVIGYLLIERRKRRHSQKELKQTEQKYRTVADYTYDWEYWQNPDGSIQWISPSCHRICGYSRESIINNPSLIYDMILDEDKMVWDNHKCNEIQESGIRTIQYRIKTATNDIRWIEHTCQSVKDEMGNTLGLRANNRDITEKEQYKSNSNKLQSDLIHMERVATISTLTYALAHEINQPLTSIRSYAQAALRFMDKDSPEEENIRKALVGIVSDNKRVSAIVNQLRNLVKRESEKMTTIDLHKLINDVLDLIKSELILRHTSVKLKLDHTNTYIAGDTIQLQQVLLNLLINGLDAMDVYTNNNRILTISTRTEKDHSNTIQIKDNGIGIPEDNLNDIFEPFHSTKQNGIGLGLAISKLIVEAHNGKIWAENNSNGGAIFKIWLPGENK